MNENTFHGTVGREIRINHSQRSGVAVVNFSIAINSRRFDKSKGQWVERPHGLEGRGRVRAVRRERLRHPHDRHARRGHR
ncbi:single-stranded DNA-binding protein [Pseudonocardia sp. RS010]|uniref:single-stranded DNA-binding protein n=1 Tax=Pseudonocardia sp. RS010 TaxID=3385979 RepID=UPI00399F1738